jgi:hypothetical protein
MKFLYSKKELKRKSFEKHSLPKYETAPCLKKHEIRKGSLLKKHPQPRYETASSLENHEICIFSKKLSRNSIKTTPPAQIRNCPRAQFYRT